MVAFRWALGMVALGAAAGAAGAAEDAREVRRAHVADQTDAWTQAGYVPGWEVKVERNEIAIGGDEKGKLRGTVLVGRPWRVPDPLPAQRRVRLSSRRKPRSSTAAPRTRASWRRRRSPPAAMTSPSGARGSRVT